MNKQTLKVVLLTVVCTLAVVGVIGAIAIPKVIEEVKVSAVTNFDDEYQELAYILDESKGPVIQPNYIITGLIMSPDFQEYLDQGVQNGWWTEEFLEQFLIDEALPIFFTNYHVLFSAILSSDPVQEAGEKVTTIKAKVEEIFANVKIQINSLMNVINTLPINEIKGLVGTLNANKAQIVGLINTLQNLDLSAVNEAIANLQNVIDSIKSIDKSSVEALIQTVTDLINAVENLDTDALADLAATLKDIKAQLETLDKDEIEAAIAKLKEIINMVNNLPLDEIANKIEVIKDFVNKVQNGGFDGVLGDILESILESDTIQDILSKLGDLKTVLQTLFDLIDQYGPNLDQDEDLDWSVDGTIVNKVSDALGFDVKILAPILNIIDVEIPEDGFVYDNNGTPAKLGDDTLTLTSIKIGYEVDDAPTAEILTDPVVVEGSNAVVIKNMIPTINSLI